jgi:hypothetical protein
MNQYEWKFYNKNEWDTFGLWTGSVQDRIAMWFMVILVGSGLMFMMIHAHNVLSKIPGVIS